MGSEIVSHQVAKAALATDAVAMAEEAIGRRLTNEDKDTTTPAGFIALAYHMKVSAVKEKILDDIDDTHFGTSFDSYIRIAMSAGFIEAHRFVFERQRTFGGDRERQRRDKLFVLYREDGALLVVESYGFSEREKAAVNSATLYYNWRPREGVKLPCPSPVSASGGWESTDDPHWRRSYDTGTFPTGMYLSHHLDVREGLRTQVKTLTDAGSFITPWPQATANQGSNMHLLAISDDFYSPRYEACATHEQKSAVIDSVQAYRMSKLPLEIQEMVGDFLGRRRGL